MFANIGRGHEDFLFVGRLGSGVVLKIHPLTPE
jgi:hypothetical protein